MNREQQLELVVSVIANVQAEILTAFTNGKIPEDWDGFELRWYLADKFEECQLMGKRGTTLARLRHNHYLETCIERNLL